MPAANAFARYSADQSKENAIGNRIEAIDVDEFILG
jgi:hypothetical protein